MEEDTKHDIEKAGHELRLAEHAFFRDAFRNLKLRHRKTFIWGVVVALVTMLVLWAASCGVFHSICKIGR